MSNAQEACISVKVKRGNGISSLALFICFPYSFLYNPLSQDKCRFYSRKKAVKITYLYVYMPGVYNACIVVAAVCIVETIGVQTSIVH